MSEQAPRPSQPAPEASSEKSFKEEFEPELRDIVYKLIERFSERTGIKIEEKDLPKVTLHPNTQTPWGERKSPIPTCSLLGNIHIAQHKMGDKTAVSEEISHSIRYRLRNPEGKKDKNVEEFFGFLGTRILYPKLNREMPFENDQEYFDHIKKLTEKFYALSSEKDAFIREAEQSLITDEIKEVQDHYFGYKFASKLDMNRVHDWQTLYAMSSADVRKKFFTDTPDYSDI